MSLENRMRNHNIGCEDLNWLTFDRFIKLPGFIQTISNKWYHIKDNANISPLSR